MTIKMPFVPPLPSASTSIGQWPAVIGRSDEVGYDILNNFRDHKSAETVIKMEDTLRGVDERTRNRVLQRLRLDQIRKTRNELKSKLDSAKQNLASLDLEKEILEELIPWWTGPVTLQRPNGSAFHRLSDAINSGQIKIIAGRFGVKNGKIAEGAEIGQLQSFVVEHDWAKAFEGATDFEGGEIQLPYERVCFEFMISGKRVCALLSEKYDPMRLCPVIETKCAGWVLPQFVYDKTEGGIEPSKFGRAGGNSGLDAMRSLIFSQIRAVCISLDAEVATTEIVRAPHKLNRAREKLGRAPLVDYHVVRLAHRSRAASLPDASGEHDKRTSPRLHFRRGHWRHFANHKSWVRWQLVGNPDLGFIDKEYRV